MSHFYSVSAQLTLHITVKLLIEAQVSIRTSNLDPRLVLETRLLLKHCQLAIAG